MSSTQLFRLSGIILLLGAVVSVIAGVMTLFLDSSLGASPTTIQSPLWSTYYSLLKTENSKKLTNAMSLI